jgi:hypothetical protein
MNQNKNLLEDNTITNTEEDNFAILANKSKSLVDKNKNSVKCQHLSTSDFTSSGKTKICNDCGVIFKATVIWTEQIASH